MQGEFGGGSGRAYPRRVEGDIDPVRKATKKAVRGRNR
jgi:hypothetical protein